MSSKQRVLPEHLPDLFDRLAQADRAHLAENATVRVLRKGEVVWFDGAPVEQVLVVRDGCLGATLRDDAGGYVVAAAFPRSRVVARSLSVAKPALLEVRALVASSVLCVPLFALRPIAQRSPEMYEDFCDAVLRALHHRMYFSSRLASAPVERRLAQVLWDLSSIDGSGQRVIDFKLGQAELAQLVGTDRTELSRRNQMLVKSGVLSPSETGWVLAPSFRMLLTSVPGAPDFELDALMR